MTLVAWLVCGIYTITYCYLNGYGIGREEPVLTTWGIPKWVLWGVFCPWVLVQGFAWWFCFRFVEDHDIGEDPEDLNDSETDADAR